MHSFHLGIVVCVCKVACVLTGTSHSRRVTVGTEVSGVALTDRHPFSERVAVRRALRAAWVRRLSLVEADRTSYKPNEVIIKTAMPVHIVCVKERLSQFLSNGY